MDAVKAFNAEMASMLDMKPPISRAKMMSITKAGMKAIKLYKHVVQIIEKFIKKCNPELKVPGLYVVDSIIRQSRHQFGEDKDVFGPRFLKNISATFQSLYECPPDDKDKILRVLSLWQKNSVFSMDIIQPLADMALAPAAHVAPILENGSMLGGSPELAECVQPPPEPPTPPVPQNPAGQQNNVTLDAVAQFLQSSQGLDLQQILQTLQQGGATQASMPTANAASTANAISAQQNNSISKMASAQDRFDYDKEPGVEHPQLVGMSPASSMNYPQIQQPHQGHLLSQFSNQAFPNTQTKLTVTNPDHASIQPITEPQTVESGHERDDRERRYSRRSRSPRRRSLSRSRSHTQHSRHRRSRSRERRRTPPRSGEEDRMEMERRNKGLPPMKRETLSVCSTTLWLGQLDKKTQQQDVSSLMEEFGQIESINMIPPRGCAYIVMVHRQDAYTALNKLTRGTSKINHKSFKIAWAMNKGVTGRFKKYWNMELGVTYVPWEKLKDTEISALREGAVLDPDTLKPEWASMQGEIAKPGAEGPETERGGGATVASQVPSVSSESGVKCTNIPRAQPVDPPSETPNYAPRCHTEALLLSSPPLPHPQCLLPFPNVLRPPNLLHDVPRAPMFRIRLPGPGPIGPADFPRPGMTEAEHWNGRPFRNDRQENGPPRGPDVWFGPEHAFRPGGWSGGGGHWGQGQFRN